MSAKRAGSPRTAARTAPETGALSELHAPEGLRPNERALLEYAGRNPGRGVPWRMLKTIEDWKQYFELHPEWKRRSQVQMKEDRAGGGSFFLSALHAWARREYPGDPQKRRALIVQLFPLRQRDWSALTTLEDWRRDLDAHPEWKGRSQFQMMQDRTGGGAAFVNALGKWATRESSGDAGAAGSRRSHIGPVLRSARVLRLTLHQLTLRLNIDGAQAAAFLSSLPDPLLHHGISCDLHGASGETVRLYKYFFVCRSGGPPEALWTVAGKDAPKLARLLKAEVLEKKTRPKRDPGAASLFDLLGRK